jgi:CIC family chloride channel protein
VAKKIAHLDEEQRALHESWDDVVRVIVVVVMTSVVIWALCAALKTVVHRVGDHLLEYVAHDGGARGAGLLLAILLVAGLARAALHKFAGWRDVEHDGIDLALANYHVTYKDEVDNPQPRYARPAFGTALRKVAATCLTLAMGGSGGLEGPVVLIGESTGAGIARVLRARSEHELRTYQLSGIAAAVGTLLNAPFTAALFAIEVVYGDRIIYRKLAYALLAGTVTYVLNSKLLGYHPIFVAPAHAHTFSLGEYGASALVAVAVSAPLALGFGLTMRHTRALAERIPSVARGAIGGLGTGVVALGVAFAAGVDVRHTLGMGDYTLRELLSGAPEVSLSSWWLLLVAAIAKMVTTGFTVQSGGSAGMLIPSMFLGGVAGAMTLALLQRFGMLTGLDPSLFVVVGIASALVGMVGVPMASIALVLEVFGAAYGPPAIFACCVTYVLTLRLSVYEQQRKSPDPEADETGAADGDDGPIGDPPTQNEEGESPLG